MNEPATTGQAPAGEVGGLRAGRRHPTPKQEIDRLRQAVLNGDWEIAGGWLGARAVRMDTRGTMYWPGQQVLLRGLELFEFEESVTMALLAATVRHRAGTGAALTFLARCWQDKLRREETERRRHERQRP